MSWPNTIHIIYVLYIKAFEPEWFNPDNIWYWVNSLRFGGLNIIWENNWVDNRSWNIENRVLFVIIHDNHNSNLRNNQFIEYTISFINIEYFTNLQNYELKNK